MKPSTAPPPPPPAVKKTNATNAPTSSTQVETSETSIPQPQTNENGSTSNRDSGELEDFKIDLTTTDDVSGEKLF